MSANNAPSITKVNHAELSVQVDLIWLLELHQEIAEVRNKTFPPRDETEVLSHNMISIQSHLSDVLDMIEEKLD